MTDLCTRTYAHVSLGRVRLGRVVRERRESDGWRLSCAKRAGKEGPGRRVVYAQFWEGTHLAERCTGHTRVQPRAGARCACGQHTLRVVRCLASACTCRYVH